MRNSKSPTCAKSTTVRAAARQGLYRGSTPLPLTGGRAGLSLFSRLGAPRAAPPEIYQSSSPRLVCRWTATGRLWDRREGRRHLNRSGPEPCCSEPLCSRLARIISSPAGLRLPAGRRWARAVGAEDLPLYASCERQEIEEVRECLPDRRAAILSEALVVESVHLREGSSAQKLSSGHWRVSILHRQANSAS